MGQIKTLTALLPHQEAAVDKLRRLKVGALYMEMGTGKTRTALELVRLRMDAGKVDCCLWLCPCSVKRNLREDILFHCGGELPGNLVIRGIESLSSSDRLYLLLLRLVETHNVFLVVDESNLIKNPFAVRTKRITELAQLCPYKLILNGTPLSKNEADLYAQWYLLDWRILGYKSYYSFSANHLEYWTVRLPGGGERVDRNRVRRVLNTDYLAEKIQPYTYQIKKEECLKLPPKQYRDREFVMDFAQQQAYEETRELYLGSVDDFRSETIYKLFTALQHVASGRRVISEPYARMQTENIFRDPRGNPRVKALLEEVAALRGEKAIIFCKYQSEIDELGRVLAEDGYRFVKFTGKLPQKIRQKNREEFRGGAQLLLANKACGAYGLNLQFCHNIIYYSNDFDLATRLQSEDRVHRLGQRQPVNIVDIYTSGIDRFIIDCLRNKESLLERFQRDVEKIKDKKLLI